MKKRGLLFIISGPAGSGKGTIVSRVRELADFYFSVSATTREARPAEVDGVHYHFIDKATFDKMVESGEMLEHAVYVGNDYGTPIAPVKQALAEGQNIILDIEVQGAFQVKEKMPEAILVFVMPPDYETLLHRIRGRGTESEAVIAKRMGKARTELALFEKYDYVIVNKENGVEEAAKDFLTILKAESMKTARNLPLKEGFFPAES